MKRFLFVICILWILTGCIADRSIEINLDHANNLMLSHPDSSLNIILTIDPQQIKTKQIEARYCLLYSQALDKNAIDLTSDTLIRPAVEYYKHHGRKIDKAKSWYYLARIYVNKGDIDNAIKSYVEAEKFMVDTRARRLLAMLYANIGNLYVQQKSFDEAEKMYDRCIEIYRGQETVNEAYALAGKAAVMNIEDKNEEALSLLNQAKEVATKYQDSLCLLRLAHSQAAILADMDDGADTQREIIDLLIDAYNRYNDGETGTEIFPLLSTCYLRLNELDSARYYVNAAIDNLEEYPTYQQVGLYLLAARIYEQSGNFEAANEILYHKIELADSLYEHDKENLVQDIEQKYRTEQVKQMNVRLRHRQIGIIIFSLFSVILIVALAWIIYLKKQAQIKDFYNFVDSLKRDYSSLEERYIALETEMGENSEKSQKLFVALDTRMKSFKKIMELAGNYEGNPPVFYEKFRKYLHHGYQKSDKALSDLFEITNLYHGGIIDFLHEHYPELNDEDLTLSCMICLGFTPQQTRLLFNHTNTSSIYTKRSKLRKKLGLSDSDNLEDFFGNLIASFKIN